MIPKFRAYDSGSLCRMYQPDEVMVGDGNIWIVDEDGVAGYSKITKRKGK